MSGQHSKKNRGKNAMRTLARASIFAAGLSIAAAAPAWADEEISYDGTVVYDTFPDGPAAGASDVGSAAISGADNDWATYIGPAGDYSLAAEGDSGADGYDVGSFGAYDASAGDVNDVATAINTAVETNSTTTQVVSDAAIYNATSSSAYADDGGWASIGNYANPEGTVLSTTATMIDDSASSTGNSGAFVTNEGGSGTISGDSATADGNYSYAYVTDYSGTGNVEGDSANASGTNSFADVGNGYNTTAYSEGVDGGKEPVSFDGANATGGATAIVGENQSDTATPVGFDLANASNGGTESLINVFGHVGENAGTTGAAAADILGEGATSAAANGGSFLTDLLSLF
jgi:hypothetical protein